MLLAADQDLDPIYHMRVIQALLLFIAMPHAKEGAMERLINNNPVLTDAITMLEITSVKDEESGSLLKDV